MNCPKCGKSNAPEACFCSNCGARLTKPPAKKSQKKTVIIVIAAIIVLGLFGKLMETLTERGSLSNPGEDPAPVITPAGTQNPTTSSDIAPSDDLPDLVPTQGAANTVMLYLDGTDIESGENRAVWGCMTNNLRQALSCGIDTAKTNVLIYTGGCAKWHDFNIPSDTDSIYKIDNGELVLLESLARRNMGDPNTLASFMQYCVSNYPAQSYSLLMADHGGGPNVGLCKDATTGDIISLDELSNVLSAKGFSGESKLECIVFDACLMASVEVAAVLKNHANFMMASENPSISSGGDYSFLSAFNTAQTGADVGQAYVEAFYQKSIAEAERLRLTGILDVTYSCIDLSAMDEVIACSDAFFRTAARDVANKYSYTKLVRTTVGNVYEAGADPNVSNPYYYDLADLYDFVLNFLIYYEDEASDLMRALDSAIIHNSSSSDLMNGLTFYFPYKNGLLSSYPGVCVSRGYFEYLYALMNAGRGTSAFSSLFSSISPVSGSGAKEFSVSMQLTPEQADDFLYGEYYVFYRPDGLETPLAADEYMWLANGFEVSLNGNSLEARIPNQACYVASEEDDYLCPVYSVKNGGQITNFTKMSLSYTPDYDPNDTESMLNAVENMRMDVGRLYLDISKNDVSAGPVFLAAEDNQYQRSPLDLGSYDSISIFTVARETAYDNDGKLLPYSQWKTNTDHLRGHSHTMDELSFSIKPLDNNADYYVMLVAHDIYGNVNCSNIVPLD